VAGLAGVALIALALVGALRPFGMTVDAGTDAHPLPVSGRCDAAAKTAWNQDDKDDLALWAVTVGTNMMGYTPVFGTAVKDTLVGDQEGFFPDSYCGGRARHRLIVDGALLTIGVAALAATTIVLARRRRTVRV
jgi:hypothetical protein